jgi:hypothetical protein
MSNRNRFAVAVMLFSAFSAAEAQQSSSNLRLAAARTPPVSKSKGPTLEFTMEYIQDRLISRGILSYKVSIHDTATGKDWSYEFIDKLSGTYANPSTCQIGFHWKQTRNGEAVTDKETYLDLSGGAKADVLAMDQYLTESAAKAGHDSWSTKVSQSLFVLHIIKADNSESNFVFPDEDTANHLSKAVMHAAELCGSAQGTSPPASDKAPF